MNTNVYISEKPASQVKLTLVLMILSNISSAESSDVFRHLTPRAQLRAYQTFCTGADINSYIYIIHPDFVYVTCI